MQARWLKLRKNLMRALVPALRWLPPRAALRLIGGIGRAEYALVPPSRRRHDEAVRRWVGHFGHPWDVARVGRDLASNELRWQARDLLLDRLPEGQLEGLFEVEGIEHLDAARAEGRGVILLGNHYGAHLLPAHYLLKRGYDLRLFMERPRHISKYLAQLFDDAGPLGQDKLFISRKSAPAEAAAAILRASRVLKAGMLLHLAGDVRWSGPHTATATFLGRSESFSATWVILAAMAAAPVVPVFCRIVPGGTYHLEFLPSFHVPPDANAGRLAGYVQDCLRTIEGRVRLDPANSNEYASWAG
jgi:lauroyl/myristoyl acyltransferase